MYMNLVESFLTHRCASALDVAGDDGGSEDVFEGVWS
jgi:hypothetical protein